MGKSECAELITRIEAAVSKVIAFIKVADAPFRITGCWVNVLDPNAAHAMHSHPNNFPTNACYVQTQEGADAISFHDPRPQAAIIRPPVIKLMAYSADQVVVTVSDRTLLVFPAWLAAFGVGEHERSPVQQRQFQCHAHCLRQDHEPAVMGPRLAASRARSNFHTHWRLK